MIIDHALERLRHHTSHYSFPRPETMTSATAAARTTMAMDGMALQSLGVPVDGMGGLSVRMVSWLLMVKGRCMWGPTLTDVTATFMTFETEDIEPVSFRKVVRFSTREFG